MDWRAWHDDYENPDSGLAQRLVLVREQIRAALGRLPPGPIKAVSMCAGQGHDLIGALEGHERRGDVTARLVELDEHNARVHVMPCKRLGSAGCRSSPGIVAHRLLRGRDPADLVLVCGVFGNISAEDIQRTIAALPQLCAADATVIWTRHRLPPDITPTIRRWFADSGFREVAFEVDQSALLAVGVQRLTGAPDTPREGERLFDFIGYDVLQPTASANQGTTLDEGRLLLYLTPRCSIWLKRYGPPCPTAAQ